jgi:hypothetical protein
VRLAPEEVAAIKHAAVEVFGPDAIVRLFGSRLDDARRGGDIDLHVQVRSGAHAGSASAQFRRLLDRRVGEREYDIIVDGPGQPLSAVSRRALSEGVVL